MAEYGELGGLRDRDDDRGGVKHERDFGKRQPVHVPRVHRREPPQRELRASARRSNGR